MLSKFETDYLTTALWASTDDEEAPLDDNYSVSDFSPTAVKQAQVECADFIARCEREVPDFNSLDMESVAHDFWLTRNRHGAGFWDGDYEEPGASILTKIAHEAGERNVLVITDAEGDTLLEFA